MQITPGASEASQTAVSGNATKRICIDNSILESAIEIDFSPLGTIHNWGRIHVHNLEHHRSIRKKSGNKNKVKRLIEKGPAHSRG